ncbi:NUDIX domain-containing protein [Oricola thermophila]|uniref:NUDIX domain-containing protein n=2 Tax=Oricola thermophila TaxID=2742145 RepID=A0A6N1VAF7_9HYPH|nr:NUDIX domain-containing protein [Oricola thermophila]
MKPEFTERIKPYGPASYTRPRDAATLILLRRNAGRTEVLMGKRNANLVFMPGMFVFPGGRTERADLTAPRTGSLHAGDAERLVKGMGAKGSLRRAEALAMSAIRETQEETGLLIGRQAGSDRVQAPRSWDAFARAGVVPDLSAIRYIARAITPPGRPRRFDTRFFAADARHVFNPDELIANPEEELDEVRWIRFGDFDGIKVPDITVAILDLLADRLKDDPDLSRDMPVPFIRVENRRFLQTFE